MYFFLDAGNLETTTAAFECTREACVESCQNEEPEMKVLNASCIGNLTCDCIYEDECTEDKCSKYCLETLKKEHVQSSHCENNVCYCNKNPGYRMEERDMKAVVARLSAFFQLQPPTVELQARTVPQHRTLKQPTKAAHQTG
ncbi:uncharacterized protein LOC144102269 [Amblyomma americanum]